MPNFQKLRFFRAGRIIGFVGLLMALVPVGVFAHPLGNFSVNQFVLVEPGGQSVVVRYVVDLAEIPTLQELGAVNADGNSVPSEGELDLVAAKMAQEVAANLRLVVDATPVHLVETARRRSLMPGAGGLDTFRIELDFRAAVEASAVAPRLVIENGCFSGRLGWREIVILPPAGVTVFDSTAFGNSLSDELKAYPQDALAAPLAEVRAEARYTLGDRPANAQPLRMRDGKELTVTRDPFAELIAVPELTITGALLGLLIAAILGGMHALSPGHGKTVVGAYLVGSRGTARHAAFLGLTVTITHTAGVFALGLVTLFASQYILPEKLFPILTAISGALVVGIGLTMFAKRLGSATGIETLDAHSHAHAHSDHDHSHRHGGHSHLPPGSDGEPVTWKSLLALGISGGLLPCPSALVVLLSAIALHRVAYGLLLVVAFSFGLASVLTAIGFAFVFAGRFVKPSNRTEKLAQWMPVMSALVITVVGCAILYGGFVEAGLDLGRVLRDVLAAADEPSFQGLGATGVLGLGLIFGLKHATEADHVIAVSTIVSEHRKLARAMLVGLLWGTGHTASLVLVGTIVLLLRISIPDTVASWLEFMVALMIIGLGAAAVIRVVRSRNDFHLHTHAHDGQKHAHVHFHDDPAPHESNSGHSHAIRKIGLKPLIVGAVHGLAGSAALTLLVLTQISSFGIGMLYLCVFGVGSIGGMLAMSSLVGVPFALTAQRLGKFHVALQVLAGVFSVLFGFWYAYETGVVASLF